MGDLSFKSISRKDELDLIKPFSLEEIKEAAWNYDSFKNLVPNDINLCFIKDF